MMNNRVIKKLFTIFAVALCMIFSSILHAEITETEQGKILFEKYCMICHGKEGRGDGQAARYLFPKPRNLTSGVFKVRSTPTGDPPTDNDIINIITNGMPGSGMPAHSELSEDEKSAIMGYLKQLGNISEEPSRIITPGDLPAVTALLIKKGKEVFKKVKCGECHGATGKGDGSKAGKLRDDAGQPAPPNAFTRGIYKGGAEPADIYLRFTAGMDGSPMPSYEDSLNDEERWAVVFYTLSLAGTAVSKQPSGGRITAEKISGEIPVDPESALWKGATAFKVPLMLLWQKPDSRERLIHVKAIHNDKEIAFLIEWNDATKNTMLDVDAFRDGIALQFPMQQEATPSFWMGDEKGNVAIWYWKADLQEKINNGLQPLPESAVENLIASGFGTLALKADNKPQHISGRGKWENGKWNVVFKGMFGEDDMRFADGKVVPVSFAVWDGAESDVDGRKAVSTWYYLVPEGMLH